MKTNAAKMRVDKPEKIILVDGIADGEYIYSVTDEGRIIIKPSNGGDKNVTVIKDGKTNDKSLLLCLIAGELDKVDLIYIDGAYFQVMPNCD